MFDFLFEPRLKWFINSLNIWQILLLWTERSIKLSDCSSSLCPNTVQSEYNSAPSSTTTSWTLLTLHRGGCHMLRFGRSRAHMPPQETSRNSPRAQQSAAPSSSYLQPAISSTHSSQLLRLNSDFTRQDQRKKKSAGCSLSAAAAAAAAAWWRSFLPRLWHGEHPSYLSTVCSGNFSKTNTQRMEGSASPYKPPPLLPPPTGSSLLPRKNRLQLSDPHNAQCWVKSQVKHTFSNCLVTCSLSCTDTEAGGLGITQWGTFRRSHGILLLSNPPTFDH